MHRLLDRVLALSPKIHDSETEIQFNKLYVSITRKLQAPQTIEWFPTYLCNSKCRYCGGYDKETVSAFGMIIPYDEVIEIIKITGRSGADIWNIGGRGGEPLLYPNLIGVMEKIKQSNMKGILITNGLLLNEAFVNRLIDCHWDILRISLDSHMPELHDELRGVKNNFKKIDRALILFKEGKKQNNKGFPHIICCPVITNKNYRYIKEYTEYCISKGVDEIQFMPLINVHERAEKFLLSDNEKNELVGALEKMICEDRIRHNIAFMASLYKNNVRMQGQESKPKPDSANKLYCIHLWKTLVISEDGYLSPCSLIKDKLVKIKGMHLEAWNSEEINRLRRKISKGELIDDACKDCCGPLKNETHDFNQFLLKHNLKIK